jgi:hypothetical protein
MDFNITAEDVTIPTHCPVLGTPLKWGTWMNSPSIDRFNNEVGYVRGNIFVISTRANFIKRDWSVDELKKVIQYMESVQ